MDVITPGFLGPSQNVQYEMKKLPPCVQKVPKTFFPRPITPRCHSFAAWVSNTSLIKVKTAILRVLSKNKIHQRLKPATQCCFEKKIIIIGIFALFSLVIASSLLDHICFFVLWDYNWNNNFNNSPIQTHGNIKQCWCRREAIASPSWLFSEKISLSFHVQQNQSWREIVILRADE